MSFIFEGCLTEPGRSGWSSRGGPSKASTPRTPPQAAFGGRVSPEKLAGGGWEERSELVQGWPVAKLGLDSETQNTEHSVISEADAETHTLSRARATR